MLRWVAIRLSILVAVFLASLLNFSAQWVARKTEDNEISARIRHSRSYVFLFGLAGLFSCNLLQSGVFEAALVWLVLASLVFMHYLNFKPVNERMRSFSRILSTALIFGQCLASIVTYLA